MTAVWKCSVIYAVSVTLVVILDCFSAARAQQGQATFEVRVHSYNNPQHSDEGNNCCDGSNVVPSCDDFCDNYFTICLQNYNSFDGSFFAPGSCPLGRQGTGLLAENNDAFTFSTPLSFPYAITSWPGQLQVAFRSQDADGAIGDGGGRDVVITTMYVNVDVFPGDGFTAPMVYTSQRGQNVELSFQVTCSANYYGSLCTTFCTPMGNFVCDRMGVLVCAPNHYGPDCSVVCFPGGNIVCNENGMLVCVSNYYGPSCDVLCIPGGNFACTSTGDQICVPNYHGSNCDAFCEARNNSMGHYSCDGDGNRVCLAGYQNPSTFCTECMPADGCSTPGGHCEEPFQCICFNDYDGDNCEIDLDPCGHRQPCGNNATCINTGADLYQCMCTEQQEGENCTLNRTDECSPNPCQNEGQCSDQYKDYTCSCPTQFTGRNCEQLIMRLQPTGNIDAGFPVGAVAGGVAGGVTGVILALVLIGLVVIFLVVYACHRPSNVHVHLAHELEMKESSPPNGKSEPIPYYDSLRQAHVKEAPPSLEQHQTTEPNSTPVIYASIRDDIIAKGPPLTDEPQVQTVNQSADWNNPLYGDQNMTLRYKDLPCTKEVEVAAAELDSDDERPRLWRNPLYDEDRQEAAPQYTDPDRPPSHNTTENVSTKYDYVENRTFPRQQGATDVPPPLPERRGADLSLGDGSEKQALHYDYIH